jgi:hypothetical protein
MKYGRGQSLTMKLDMYSFFCTFNFGLFRAEILRLNLLSRLVLDLALLAHQARKICRGRLGRLESDLHFSVGFSESSAKNTAQRIAA